MKTTKCTPCFKNALVLFRRGRSNIVSLFTVKFTTCVILLECVSNIYDCRITETRLLLLSTIYLGTVYKYPVLTLDPR